MGQDSSTIRKDIEATRERMGDTVDALAYKTDVGARTRDAVTGRVDSVKEKLGVASDRVSGATDALPSGSDVRQQGRKAKGLAQENPLGLAVGALAVGFVAGLLIPNTQVENEKMAPVVDELTDHVQEAAQVAVQHGKEAAKDLSGAVSEAASDVAETAKDVGQQHAQDAKSDLADTAQDAKASVQRTTPSV